jgi:excisionase family DNA binding protein
MKKSYQKEMTVEEASRQLAVTPRSVINFINTKQIEAIKVGKSWFINQASLEAFKQRYQLGTPVQAHLQSSTQEVPASNKKRSYPVSTLRLFEIARQTLREIRTTSYSTHLSPETSSQIERLKTEAIELIGAGFYSYDHKLKASLYHHSRSKVGGLLSLFYFLRAEGSDIPLEIKNLEEQLMPAYSSLIRSIENKTRANKK